MCELFSIRSFVDLTVCDLLVTFVLRTFGSGAVGLFPYKRRMCAPCSLTSSRT